MKKDYDPYLEIVKACLPKEVKGEIKIKIVRSRSPYWVYRRGFYRKWIYFSDASYSGISGGEFYLDDPLVLEKLRARLAYWTQRNWKKESWDRRQE